MTKKIFLTGAAGFIGFHTALALSRRGDHVIGFDNFNPYYSPLLKEKRAKILENAGIQVIRGDLSNRSFLYETLDQSAPTHILHLAAQAGVRYAKENPEAYFSSNLEGFFFLLEYLKNHPKIPFVYASSSSVYGGIRQTPFQENQITDTPVNLYAATKKSNELLAYSYHHLYDIACTGLRYFTVYGPFGRPDMAYFSFTKKILEGTPIQLFNFGDMQRDFTYIDDIVQGTLAALENCKNYHVYNLGNNQPKQLETFVSLLEKFLGKKALIEPTSASKDEMLCTYADITLAQKELGYKPYTSLEEGLERFVQWYLSEDNCLNTLGSASTMSVATME